MRAGTQVFTSPSYRDALIALGDRTDGPDVLAIAAASVPSETVRGARRQSSWHRHHRGHLACAEEGVSLVHSERSTLVVPPNRAVWMPPGCWHSANTNAATYSWNLYLLPQVAWAMPTEPSVLGVNPLISALVDRAVAWTRAGRLTPHDAQLMGVLLGEIAAAPRSSAQLPVPEDRRARQIVEALLRDPADTRSREAWAAWAGLSTRTLSRLFHDEVRMSFAHWRDQLRLMTAVERLAQGESVGAVADALGYASASGFIAMFRRHFGASPRRYLAAGRTL